MTLEEFFVDGDVLDRDDPPPRLVLGDRVDEDGRIPVTEPVEDEGDVDVRHGIRDLGFGIRRGFYQLESRIPNPKSRLASVYCFGAAAGFASSALMTSGVRSRPGAAHANP